MTLQHVATQPRNHWSNPGRWSAKEHGHPESALDQLAAECPPDYVATEGQQHTIDMLIGEVFPQVDEATRAGGHLAVFFQGEDGGFAGTRVTLDESGAATGVHTLDDDGEWENAWQSRTGRDVHNAFAGRADLDLDVDLGVGPTAGQGEAFLAARVHD